LGHLNFLLPFIFAENTSVRRKVVGFQNCILFRLVSGEGAKLAVRRDLQ